MGFWNVKATDLREGDEIRVTVMGGEEYLTVEGVHVVGDQVRAQLAWGPHVPREPFEDVLPRDEKLTVRR